MIDSITYDGGVRQSRLRKDNADAFGWHTIETTYRTNGAVLFDARTEDDGTTRYADVRGLNVIAGGNSGVVTEDAESQLETSGRIETAEGYRGSSTFVLTGGRVEGSAGLGVFTLDAKASWTDGAVNNQAAIQALNAGENLTDSFTALTEDGVQTEVTVTLNRFDDDPAPIYVGGALVRAGSVGNLASAIQSFDLSTLFSDDMGDDLTIAVQSLHAGFSVVGSFLTFGTGLESGRKSHDRAHGDGRWRGKRLADRPRHCARLWQPLCGIWQRNDLHDDR